MDLPYGLAIPLLGNTQEKLKYIHTNICTYVFIAALFIITKKVKTTQMSIKWWTGKQNVVDPNNGILFGNKKKWSTDKHYNMDEPWKYC